MGGVLILALLTVGITEPLKLESTYGNIETSTFSLEFTLAIQPLKNPLCTTQESLFFDVMQTLSLAFQLPSPLQSSSHE